MKRLFPLALAAASSFALGGCITYHTVNDGITRAQVNEAVTVGPVHVIPLAILEDSRCAAGTQCVWAGTVRIRAQVTGSTGASQTREMKLGEPLALPEGALTLVEVYPDKRKDTKLYPEEYRLGFRFGS
jgi:hypothetical protein